MLYVLHLEAKTVFTPYTDKLESEINLNQLFYR